MGGPPGLVGLGPASGEVAGDHEAAEGGDANEEDPGLPILAGLLAAADDRLDSARSEVGGAAVRSVFVHVGRDGSGLVGCEPVV